DPGCDAYWIPIPYFECKPDGSLGPMRYEGAECYGDKTECADWREYDIEARRPDAIFTFNPYDGGNLVTRVHPDFYCERLRDLTDALVYIPYFATTDDVPEHFCTLAGCVFAHRVIVQSEKVRETYVRVFKKAYGDRFGRPEDKFVALGSPKFDKVINTKREDCALPDAWRELIGDKKVIFYNTSIGALLASNEQYLKKLRHVLDTFKNRDDIALWWRPHPLNEATYASMRPQLFREYEQIVADYRREGFGIYDDTADLHRAIALSDAYYGDVSSVVALYLCTGKPMMLQNAESTACDAKHKLLIEDMCDDGEYYWFVPLTLNALFRMDKNTWKPEYMGGFPGENLGRVWRLYSSVTAYGDRLIFAPGSAKEIAEYDKRTGEFRKIPLPPPPATHKKTHEKGLHTPYFAFVASVRYQSGIFFIPGSFPAIVRYDADTGAFDCFEDWIEPLSALSDYGFTPKPVGYFWRNGCVVGTSAMVASPKGNAVLEFDMENCASTVHEVGSARCKYMGICFDGETCWLAPRHDGPIVRWNPKTMECKEYDDFPSNGERANFSFAGCAYADGFVWMLPNLANTALKINPVSEEIGTTEEFRVECDADVSDGGFPNKYVMIKNIEGALFAQAGRSGALVEYRPGTNELRKEIVTISGEDGKAFAEIFFAMNASALKEAMDCVFYESADRSLSAYVEYAATHETSRCAKVLREAQPALCDSMTKTRDGSCGQSIFNYCKNRVI
ncbi:MAG: hypothetical protein LBP30_08705, partial [Clostridiales Family XIII bacterium]|nr:hypothetical protein [Clostridiales Family XIII bacterium]